MRERLAELVKEFDAVLVPGGEITYLGTPQTEMSLYNNLPERGYEIQIWPARYPSQKRRESYGATLAAFVGHRLDADPTLSVACNGRGAPTDPKRFDDRDLMEREASYGRSGFSLQFMLDTSLSDADRYPLKLSDLIVMNLSPDLAPVKVIWASSPDQLIDNLPVVGFSGDRYHRPMFIAKDFIEYQGGVLAIDPSGRGGDETGYAVVKMLNGMLYVLEAGGLKGGYDDTVLEQLAKIAKRNKVSNVLIESNFGDGMFTKLLTPFLVRIYPCTIEEVRSSIQKEKRIIDVMEPVMNQHRLVFNEQIIKDDVLADEPKYQLMYQLTRITKDRGAIAKDDRLDALAMAVAYWVEQMDRDTSVALNEYNEQLLQDELDRFMDSVLGGTSGNKGSWM
jgi:Holliday junction resolvasome RuvABC endonuclease subunit